MRKKERKKKKKSPEDVPAFEPVCDSVSLNIRGEYCACERCHRLTFREKVSPFGGGIEKTTHRRTILTGDMDPLRMTKPYSVDLYPSIYLYK